MLRAILIGCGAALALLALLALAAALLPAPAPPPTPTAAEQRDARLRLARMFGESDGRLVGQAQACGMPRPELDAGNVAATRFKSAQRLDDESFVAWSDAYDRARAVARATRPAPEECQRARGRLAELRRLYGP